MKYLVSIKLPIQYLQKWNWCYSNDFKTFSDKNKDICLVDEKEVGDYELFRVGGLYKYDRNREYNLLLKYSENFYPDTITKDEKAKPHLSDTYVVVGKECNVVFESPRYRSTYLHGCIVSVDGEGFYNLEKDNKHYKGYYERVLTENHVILHGYDQPAIIINKLTGEETFID